MRYVLVTGGVISGISDPLQPAAQTSSMADRSQGLGRASLPLPRVWSVDLDIYLVR
jgi:hypothetical protein